MPVRGRPGASPGTAVPVQGKKQPDRTVVATVNVLRLKGHEKGWKNPHDAARAFFEHYESAYQNTDSSTELVGLIVKTKEGRYLFTEAVKAPSEFRFQARVRGLNGAKPHALMHTHPANGDDQEGFSPGDVKALRAPFKSSYIRTPEGHLRYLRNRGSVGAMRDGAKGRSLCDDWRACLPPHQKN